MKTLQIILCILATTFIVNAQQSPFGTGTVLNQNIGPLDDDTAPIDANSIAAAYFNNLDYNNILNNLTYDLYIPTDYDSTEEYGIVLFTNSSDDGSVKTQWIPVLEERNLIWVSPDMSGNTVFTSTRTSNTWAAYWRLRELYKIDEDRVYTSGNSGGARMANTLAFCFPEIIDGTMPLCGASYMRTVDQDYETQNPNSNYELIFSFDQTEQDYIKSFDQKYAIMTEFDDFREGDIMNIYHNGHEEDGTKAKFLETSGGHCTTSEQHFRDALNFVEHPFISVIDDNLDGTSPAAGNGFVLENASLASQRTVLQPTTDAAQVKAKDLFRWNDAEGAIVEVQYEVESASFNSNSKVHLGLWGYTDDNTYTAKVGTVPGAEQTLLLTIDYSEALPVVMLVSNNPDNGTVSDTLFMAVMNDWSTGQTDRIKFHLWEKELRIEFANHFDVASILTGDTRQLDDGRRSVRLRWPSIGGGYYLTTSWEDGAYLTLAAEKVNSANASANIFLETIQVVGANQAGLATLPGANPTAVIETKLQEIAISPNPTTGTIRIELPAESHLLTLTDMTGQTVYQAVLSGLSTIDVSELASGVYIGRVEVEGQLKQFKLVKE